MYHIQKNSLPRQSSGTILKKRVSFLSYLVSFSIYGHIIRCFSNNHDFLTVSINNWANSEPQNHFFKNLRHAFLNNTLPVHINIFLCFYLQYCKCGTFIQISFHLKLLSYEQTQHSQCTSQSLLVGEQLCNIIDVMIINALKPAKKFITDVKWSNYFKAFNR